MLLIGYFIYDFYNYITKNIPALNAYAVSTVNSASVSMLPIAFGVYFYNTDTDTYTILDNSYLFYNFYVSYHFKENNTILRQQIPLANCSDTPWASKYSNLLTCLNLTNL